MKLVLDGSRSRLAPPAGLENYRKYAPRFMNLSCFIKTDGVQPARQVHMRRNKKLNIDDSQSRIGHTCINIASQATHCEFILRRLNTDDFASETGKLKSCALPSVSFGGLWRLRVLHASAFLLSNLSFCSVNLRVHLVALSETTNIMINSHAVLQIEI